MSVWIGVVPNEPHCQCLSIFKSPECRYLPCPRLHWTKLQGLVYFKSNLFKSIMAFSKKNRDFFYISFLITANFSHLYTSKGINNDFEANVKQSSDRGHIFGKSCFLASCHRSICQKHLSSIKSNKLFCHQILFYHLVKLSDICIKNQFCSFVYNLFVIFSGFILFSVGCICFKTSIWNSLVNMFFIQ